MRIRVGAYAFPSFWTANRVSLLPLIFMLTACSSSPDLNGSRDIAMAQPQALYRRSPSADSAQLDQSQILQAQAQGLSKVEVLFAAKVLKLLPEDTRGLPHQRFLLLLNNGTTILVAHDTKYAPKVPIQAGDTVVIRGEYVWNKKGGLVHWTHHSDSLRHESGYIDFKGMRYQ